MSTDKTPQKRKPTGSANSTAGGTDKQITSRKLVNNKNYFQQLKGRYLLQGHRLYRTDPADGCVLYFIERLGMIQLADLRLAIATVEKLEARR